MTIDYTQLLGIAAPTIAGMAGGAAAGQSQQLNQRQAALQQYMAALQNEAQMQEGFLNRDRQSALNVAQLDPLGAQQQYAQRQQMMRALMGGIVTGGTDRIPGNPQIAQAMGTGGGGIQGILQGMAKSGLQSGAFGPEATARALADHRSNLMQVNPYAHFGTLGEYGLDPSYDRDWRNSGEATIGRRMPIEEAMRGSMSQATGLAQQNYQNASDDDGGTPWWKKILGPAAGIGAAFIPGVGPILSGLIGAGVGGATNGVQGAILGGASGVGADWLQGKLGGGNGPQLNNQMGSVAGFNQPGVANPMVAPKTALNLQNGGIPMGIPGLQPVVGQNRPNLGSPAQNARQNFISPQDLALAGGLPQLPQGNQNGPGNIPNPNRQWINSLEVHGTAMPTPWMLGGPALNTLGNAAKALPPAGGGSMAQAIMGRSSQPALPAGSNPLVRTGGTGMTGPSNPLPTVTSRNLPQGQLPQTTQPELAQKLLNLIKSQGQQTGPAAQTTNELINALMRQMGMVR